MDIIKLNSNRLLTNFLGHRFTIHKIFDLNNVSFNNNLKCLDDILIQCPICYSKTNDAFRPDQCAHYFCKICIDIWTKYENICPYCRKKFNFLLHR